MKKQAKHSERNTQIKNGGNGRYQYDVQLQILNVNFKYCLKILFFT